MIRNVLHTLGSLRTALAAAVGVPFLIAVAAHGQTEATTERVYVTGTYIPTAESESALPVTVYTAEVLKKQGANTPVEGLRQLPSFVGNAATENDSNGGDGTATINLRAIGPANVLILVNGRRTFNFSDINLIPIGATSRTEVLKDGASSIYGSDAVAGVVNFILLNGPGEKPYEGAELFALYGNTTETDAHVRQVYLRGGVTGLDGKVSIAAEGEYYSRANLYSRDRFAVAGTANASNLPTTDPHFGGGTGWGGQNANSPTYSGRVSVIASTSPKYPQFFLPGTGAAGQATLINQSDNQVTVGSYRPFDAAGGSTDPNRFNFRAFTPAIPAMEKAMYFVTGRYKIFGDGLQLYGDLLYAKSKQDNGLAAAPFSITNVFNGLVESRASQFNPFGNDLASVRYRLVNDLGPRRSFFDKDAWRYVAGINGDFNFKDNGFISHFSYDVGFVYERFDELRIDSGDATRSALLNLITAGAFDIFIGQNAPVTGFAPTYVNGVPTGKTAPYDNTIAGISNYSTKNFTDATGTVSALQGASYIGHSEFYERDWMVDPKINAHLFPNLWDGGWDFAIGYQHYHTAQHSVPDPVQAAGDQLGFNQAPNFKYQRDVDAVFVELGIPIVTSTMNVPFVRSLDLDIAWRREWFDDKDQYTHLTHSYTNENEDENFGGSPRVSIRYQPIPDLTLRASWGQSFRSASLNAQFSPVAQNFPLIFDPFKNATLQPPEGVWQGGNVALKPERTDAYSAGLVYTPKWLPGFTMTMDWYQLFTRDLIVGAADFAQLMLTANGTTTTNVAPFNDGLFYDPDDCGNGSGALSNPGGPALGISRDPASGALRCIDSNNSNAGKRLVQGLDVTAVYELPTERWGKFTFSGGYNHFFTWKAEPLVGFGTHSFLGTYNNGTIPLAPGAIPWNKAFLRGEWEWKHFDFIATGNYIGDFRDDEAFFGAGRLNLYPGEPRNVPSYITLDLQLSYEWVKPPTEPAPYVKESKDSKNAPVTEAATASIWQRMLWGTKLTVGVNDVFDRYPPSVLGAFNDNYDTSLYSIRNRYWYVSLTKRF